MRINYAWANPITGQREQTASCHLWNIWKFRQLGREARFRAWFSLQASNEEFTAIHVQTRIGEISPGHSEIDRAAVNAVERRGVDYEFAWTDPWSGARIVSQTWPHHLAAAMNERHVYAAEVWVYATLATYPIRKDAPRPEPGVNWWARLCRRFRREPDMSRFELPVVEPCTCQGDGIAQRGEFCVCEKGKELYRASVVAKREPHA